MKELDLNAYGVVEMNAAEAQQIDGGNLFRSVSKLLEIIGVLEVAEAFVNGFTEGVKEGFNEQQNQKK